MKPSWLDSFANLPASEKLKELLSYGPMTGVLRWKPRPQTAFSSKRAWKMWTTKFCCAVAGHKQFDEAGRPNCIRVRIDDKEYVAHHIIWKMLGLSIPTGMMLDHADGHPFNNRIDNIRLSTPSQNSSNKTVNPLIRKHKLPKGVVPSGNKNGRPWRARIKLNGKTKYLGAYATIEQAKAARDSAATLHHGHFARS